jgi:hypothetical protein
MKKLKFKSARNILATGVLTCFFMPPFAAAQTVYDIPAKYVSVCYDWLKGRNSIGDVSPEQLTSALQQVLARNPSVPGRTTIEKGDIESALRWSDTLAEKKDCYRASIGIINVQAAVQLIQREREEREDKAKEAAQENFLREHAEDSVTIDYAEYRQSVTGKAGKPRKPTGSVRKLTLAQYLAWEKQMKDKWAVNVMNAGSNANVYQTHAQCKGDIAQQWVASFGYADSILRSPALIDKGVTRSLVTSIACMTEFVRAAGIPVDNSLPKEGKIVQF